MNFNFNILEMGFKAYLEKLQRETGSDGEIDLSAISIFSYSEEFKDYVSQELNLNSSELPSDFTDILNMEIVDGEIVFPEDEYDSENNNSEFSEEDTGLVGVVNNLLKDDDVINVLDVDKSGDLNNDEVTNFLQFLTMQDKNANTLSINDIVLGIDKLKDSNFDMSSFTELPEIAAKDNTVSVPESSTSDSGGGSSGGGSSSYSFDGGSTPTTTPKTETTNESKYKNMELADLEKAAIEQKETISSSLNDVKAIYSGTNEKVKAAEENLKQSEDAYTKAVQEDEKISEELKSEQKSNLDEINLEEDNNDSLRDDVDSLETAISLKTSEINSISSNITALESSLTQLSSQTSDKPEVQASIDMQKGIVSTKLEAAKIDLKKAEEDLTKLNESKKAKEEDLAKSDDALKELETKRSDIEAKILENASSDTATLLTDFQKAKTDATNVKNTELSVAKSNLQTQQKTLQDINSYLNVKKAQQIKKENKISTGELFDPDSKYTTQYIYDGSNMPYLLIAPEGADPNEELPVLVYMHGAGEVGAGERAMLSVGPGKFMPNWDLENFNGYVICPVLTGKYNAGNWNNKKAEGYIRDILTDFESTHAVDKDKMAVAGHSLGGMGALYMAKNMEDVFSSAAVLSGYDVGIKTSDINIPIIGYVGTSEAQGPMNQLFKNTLGEEYLVHVQANHGGVPGQVLTRDSDGNGRSDFFEFLFGDKELDEMK